VARKPILTGLKHAGRLESGRLTLVIFSDRRCRRLNGRVIVILEDPRMVAASQRQPVPDDDVMVFQETAASERAAGRSAWIAHDSLGAGACGSHVDRRPVDERGQDQRRRHNAAGQEDQPDDP
jgi:hypothetical protein